MKTVGEPFEIAFGVRLDQAQFVADDILQRRARLPLALPISSRES